MIPSDLKTCPGIKKLVRPTPEYFPCPNCAGSVEIWSDENIGICDNCGEEFDKFEKEKSCLDWCDCADQCRELISRKMR